MVKKKTLLILLFFLLIPAIFNACIQLRESTSALQDKFPDARVELMQERENALRYMSLHRNDTFPTIFFLHGSPSSLSVYNTYYSDTNLASWANIITADRPGYGYSNLGKAEKSIVKQAEKMWKILEEEGYPSPLYLLGSSYGGSVAVKMAMMKPEKVSGIILVSASMAPGMEKTYAISHVFKYKAFSWMLPAMLRTANEEKLSHYEALTEILPHWHKIIAPVILFQGTEDDLIYPENVNFARKKLKNSVYVELHLLKGEGHFLQLKYKDLILSRLKSLIDSVQIKNHLNASIGEMTEKFSLKTSLP